MNHKSESDIEQMALRSLNLKIAEYGFKHKYQNDQPMFSNPQQYFIASTHLFKIQQ